MHISPHNYQAPVGTIVREARERFGAVGNELFEGAENGTLGGGGEEENHVEDHRVW